MRGGYKEDDDEDGVIIVKNGSTDKFWKDWKTWAVISIPTIFLKIRGNK